MRSHFFSPDSKSFCQHLIPPTPAFHIGFESQLLIRDVIIIVSCKFGEHGQFGRIHAVRQTVDTKARRRPLLVLSVAERCKFVMFLRSRTVE